jgi:hypothetical protein
LPSAFAAAACNWSRVCEIAAIFASSAGSATALGAASQRRMNATHAMGDLFTVSAPIFGERIYLLDDDPSAWSSQARQNPSFPLQTGMVAARCGTEFLASRVTRKDFPT